jgi:hypothetical protein
MIAEDDVAENCHSKARCVLLYPLSTPVVTSFGRMLDRPAVFVRVEDDDVGIEPDLPSIETYRTA